MATQKFIPFPFYWSFPQVIPRLVRIAQALSRAACPHSHDELLKSRQATAETACYRLAVHAHQGGAA